MKKSTIGLIVLVLLGILGFSVLALAHGGGKDRERNEDGREHLCDAAHHSNDDEDDDNEHHCDGNQNNNPHNHDGILRAIEDLRNKLSNLTNKVNGLDSSTTMKTKFGHLNDNTVGHDKGWNPDGTITAFTINEDFVNENSVVHVTIDHAGGANCHVNEITNSDFRIACDGAIDDGATLNYVVMNPN